MDRKKLKEEHRISHGNNSQTNKIKMLVENENITLENMFNISLINSAIGLRESKNDELT